MKITVESTAKIVTLNGVQTRVCFIARVAVNSNEDCSQLEAELKETPPAKPSPDVQMIPLRMII